jgi:signal peptidase I
MRKKEKKNFTYHVKTLCYALFLALIIRGIVFEIFVIPSSSMKSNILINDHLLVTKYSYGIGPFSFLIPLPLQERIWFREPKRGDIIVLRSPDDDDDKKYYIKRLIGLPGDKIQLIDRVIYINDKACLQQPLGTFSDGGIILQKYLETNPEKFSYEVLYDHQKNEQFFPNSTPLYTIPKGYYFFMGDNRNNSIDSRFSQGIGFVHQLRLLGKAQYILWNGSLFDLILGKATRFFVKLT